MHIKSLYTNIPHKDGVEAVKQIINKHNTDPKLPYWILHYIECILKNNNFTFNHSNYIQMQGTAMGKNRTQVWQYLHAPTENSTNVPII